LINTLLIATFPEVGAHPSASEDETGQAKVQRYSESPKQLRQDGRPSSQEPQLVEARMSLDELRCEWRRLYEKDPPRISRDLLVLGIGYRRQELQHGGLGKATLRKLTTLAKTLRQTGRVGPAPILSLKAGTRLVREWHGRTHTVTVTEDGFEYDGASYPSLTKIAKAITGAHWSGPRFFGLGAQDKRHPMGAPNG
jgi:hypothetical protein